MDSTNIYQTVQDHYGSVARADHSGYSTSIAKAFGYSEEELNSIPKDANLGVSCGNPLVIASLREVNSLQRSAIISLTATYRVRRLLI
jgi:arsenite methyltransferase